MKKVTRKLRGMWSVRRSSALYPLVGCVIVLQTFILIRMNADSAGATIGEERREVNEDWRASGLTSSYFTYPEPTKTPSLFDLQSCECGLHFRVDPEQARLFPARNATGKRYLTIGIPTIRRRNDSYIVKTVMSLMSNMDAVQHNDVTIVIMVGDLDPKDRNSTVQELSKNFRAAIEAGNIHVIAPPAELYTNFKITKQTYGQDLPYVEWRSKQNFDYAYIMRYSASLSLYYMQLEDDVIAAQNYVTSIRQYIDEQKDSWTCLEFSELGFIGKLYRSRDLDKLSQLLMMFYQEQPVDYTYLYFNMLMTQLQKRLRTPTLFQHQGIHSSFPGKIQPLKDRYFDNMMKRYKGDNPPAEVFTTLKTYLNFLPRLPYAHSEGYFWTDGNPKTGDTFIVVFDVPQRVERIIIDTGSESHPDDILQHAVLKASLTLIKNPARVECTNDIDLGQFVQGRIEVKGLGELIKFKVMCLQIEVRQDQDSWAIIREIAVFVAKES